MKVVMNVSLLTLLTINQCHASDECIGKYTYHMLESKTDQYDCKKINLVKNLDDFDCKRVLSVDTFYRQELISKYVDRAYKEAIGNDNPSDNKKFSNKVVAAKNMEHLANISACIATTEGAGTAYFSEMGGPLYDIIGLKRTAPLRLQYEAAIKALPDVKQKKAALKCIKEQGNPKNTDDF